MEREKPNLSLYGLEEELLELLQRRDDVAGEIRTTVEDKAAQEDELQAIDGVIADYLQRQSIAKADSVIAALRECRMAAEALRAEAKRLTERAEQRETRAKWIREMAAERLAQEIDPQVIEASRRSVVLFRVNGRLGQIKLAKSPESADIRQAELLPPDVLRRRVTLPETMWQLLVELAGCAGHPEAIGLESLGKVEPDHAEILRRLKSGEPVPGAQLVRDRVHLRIDD